MTNNLSKELLLQEAKTPTLGQTLLLQVSLHKMFLLKVSYSLIEIISGGATTGQTTVGTADTPDAVAQGAGKRMKSRSMFSSLL